MYQSQKDPFCLIILYDILFYFIHVHIAPGQGETALGDNFLWKQKGLITLMTGCMFKNLYICPLIVCTFFMILYMYIASAGQITHLGQSFDVNRKASSLYTHIHDLIKVYSPGAGTDNPKGHNFDVNRNILRLRSFVTSFKIISLKSDFMHIFLMILYMYIAPGQGQTTPFVPSLKINLFEHIYFSCFNTCI